MSVWMVRAGKNGEREDLALERGAAVIGWDKLPDLSEIDDREKLTELMQRRYPDEKKMSVANYVGQVWAFRGRIAPGDLIVLPLKTRAMIAIGECTGAYKYESANPTGSRHVRPVKWIREDIPRETFGKDLLYSLGAFMTVCQIKRNQAEQRIRRILKGEPDPLVAPVGEAATEPDDTESVPDLEQYAADQIRQYIARKFKGHELAQVVGEVLQAEGYQLQISPPGPDGGVDILAGRGLMGFDEPRLCVQVKSTNAAVDAKVFRELRGTMEDRGADQGLLVSWSGFTRPTIEEARRQFFRVRLWDSGILVSKLLANYEKLSEELRAELPQTNLGAGAGGRRRGELMPTLASQLRNQLERVVIEARDVAEAGARAALEALAVHHHEPYRHMDPAQRELRNHLRARARQLGDRQDRSGRLAIDHLAGECAYEHWHRMLFARFLAENGLLIEPEMGVAMSLAEAEELATDVGVDVWVFASRCAQRMLPQIFRPDDPLLQIGFATEHMVELERLLDSLPPAVFAASDALGWVYQFWQSKLKGEVNRSEVKIGADEISAVTQLFTEPYMVEFLLHNTLGAWWAGKKLTAEDAENAESEEELRKKGPSSILLVN